MQRLLYSQLVQMYCILSLAFYMGHLMPYRLRMSVFSCWALPVWGGIVWYLFTLIYNCITIYFIYNKLPRLIKFLPLLIIGYFCLVPYSISLIHENGWKSSIVINNFVVEGIPLIALGWNIRPLTKWNINWKVWAFFSQWYLPLRQYLRHVQPVKFCTHGFRFIFHHPTNYLHNDGSSDISAIQMAFRLAVHCRAEICDIYIYISFHLGKHKIITQYNKRYPIYGFGSFFSALILSVIHVDVMKPLFLILKSMSDIVVASDCNYLHLVSICAVSLLRQTPVKVCTFTYLVMELILRISKNLQTIVEGYRGKLSSLSHRKFKRERLMTDVPETIFSYVICRRLQVPYCLQFG